MPFGLSQASVSQKAVLNILFGWGPAEKTFSTEVFRKRRQLSSIREIGNNPALSGRITLGVAVRHKRIVYSILSSASWFRFTSWWSRKQEVIYKKRKTPEPRRTIRALIFFFFLRERESKSLMNTHTVFFKHLILYQSLLLTLHWRLFISASRFRGLLASWAATSS